MRLNNNITAHQLTKILLDGKDLPIVIPSSTVRNKAETIENIYLIENDDSPFEQCLLLEGLLPLEKYGLINITHF